MNIFRRISASRLALLLATVVVMGAAAAGIALAASGSSGSPPPPKPLADALHDALAATPPDGISGQLSFTNHLFPSGTLAGSPLVSGATGRFWATADGHVRLELQSSDGTGDVQVVFDGSTLQVYDGSSNTVYRFPVPQDQSSQQQAHAVPTVTQIQSRLEQLAGTLDVSGAVPGTVAGQPAYTVRISPKSGGGLIGAAELAWDAGHGVPLRVAVYARGDSSPALELTATQIQYGPVPASDVDISPPADAHVVDLGSGSKPDGSSGTPVTGLSAVAAAVSFPLSAPDSLAGLSRSEVRLVHLDGSPAALVVYGNGLGGIAVLESQAKQQPSGSSGGSSGSSQGPGLPTVSIGGVTGQELPTALGTVIRFERGGISYLVAGSVPATTALDAARGLAG